MSDRPEGAPARKGVSRAQLQLLIIGLVAMALPLCFVVIILVINFGSGR